MARRDFRTVRKLSWVGSQAATGASTKELMSRMGQAGPRAALIYQHVTRERHAVIAAALSHPVCGATPDGETSAGQSRVGGLS